MKKKNILMIGMPASGKSTIGVLLVRSDRMPAVPLDIPLWMWIL